MAIHTNSFQIIKGIVHRITIFMMKLQSKPHHLLFTLYALKFLIFYDFYFNQVRNISSRFFHVNLFLFILIPVGYGYAELDVPSLLVRLMTQNCKSDTSNRLFSQTSYHSLITNWVLAIRTVFYKPIRHYFHYFFLIFAA